MKEEFSENRLSKRVNKNLEMPRAKFHHSTRFMGLLDPDVRAKVAKKLCSAVKAAKPTKSASEKYSRQKLSQPTWPNLEKFCWLRK